MIGVSGEIVGPLGSLIDPGFNQTGLQAMRLYWGCV